MRNRTIIIRLFFLFCFAVFPSAYAQDMSFNYLTTDNGLSQFTVYALYNDEWGQIWIGTRGWSEYTLAENSGLTQSTLSTWRRRNLQPNVTSIEKICHGLGITLSQFFEEDTAVHHLTEEQKSLLTIWDRLSPSQRIAILDLIRAFLPE